MPRAQVNDHANAETRAKGARAANAARIKNREKREAEADEALVNSLGRAVEVLSEALEATLSGNPDYPTRLRSASAILDRLIGKPSQRVEHEGRVTHDVVYARSRLAALLTERAEPARAPRGSE